MWIGGRERGALDEHDESLLHGRRQEERSGDRGFGRRRRRVHELFDRRRETRAGERRSRWLGTRCGCNAHQQRREGEAEGKLLHNRTVHLRLPSLRVKNGKDVGSGYEDAAGESSARVGAEGSRRLVLPSSLPRKANASDLSARHR